MTKSNKRRMNKRSFVLKAIHTLRKTGYIGIHAVYSGFNKAFREYYNDDPIAEVDKLVAKGVIVKQPVKGGVMLYDAKEYKESDFGTKKRKKKNSNTALKKILGK
ncbi:MAG: hypothetical protein WDZ70_01265 [Candidatus Paceibacterota bacterium]